MANFSEIEEQLLKSVTDGRLRTNLAQIREAVERIWSEDAIRIVQFFTDHGVKHSERLAFYANELLNANLGRTISSKEMYLLLAGIYLHDIGMQCDVVKFLEIKIKAEELGAEFEIEFTNHINGGYGIDQQKAIRNNHHYLTAAWIDFANRTGRTSLGSAAKEIPNTLVDDLMDICKFHSKLPINSCPQNLKYDPNGRKQLVAALLRFSDELDIDANRVSIETVKDFSIDPRNGIYWWMHNNTILSFSDRNLILINVQLHPHDMKLYGSIINKIFISEFQSKNRQVLTLMAHNSIPILISDDSKILENDRLELLPSDIGQALLELQQKGNALDELRDIGNRIYEITDEYPTVGIAPLSKSIQLEPEEQANWGFCYNVPQFPPRFLPRPDDLKAVREALLADTSPATAITGTQSWVGLYGMGGIGKSVLAATVARDKKIRSHFMDGIFWLTLGIEPNITRRQSDLAGLLDTESHVFEDAEQGRIYLSKSLAHKACLIILDDIWHAEDVKELFGDIGQKCRILITTRDAGIIKALCAREYRLSLLSNEKSIELLAKCK